MPRDRLGSSVLTDRLPQTFQPREDEAEFADDQAAQKKAQASRDRFLAEQGQPWVWLKRLDPPEQE